MSFFTMTIVLLTDGGQDQHIVDADVSTESFQQGNINTSQT